MNKVYQIYYDDFEVFTSPFPNHPAVIATISDESRAKKVESILNSIKDEEGKQKYYAFIREEVIDSFDLLNASIAGVNEDFEELGLMGW